MLTLSGNYFPALDALNRVASMKALAAVIATDVHFAPVRVVSCPVVFVSCIVHGVSCSCRVMFVSCSCHVVVALCGSAGGGGGA